MLHKIEKLTSIGKFRDYTASGDVSFKKLTLIYADNGAGKTTLTSIIRSMCQNDTEIIKRRISTNATLPQVAQLITKDLSNTNTSHSYRTSGWSASLSSVEIFDIHFINDNVYSGFDFSDDHKKKLHQFVIGAQGVALRQSIEKNKDDKVKARQELVLKETQLIQAVGSGLSPDTLTDFINTKHPTQNIDEKITLGEAALKSAQENKVINTLQNISTLGAVTHSINLDLVSNDLSSNLQAVQNNALQELYKAHCEKLQGTINNPTIWLKEGFSSLNVVNGNPDGEPDMTCPFCCQSVDANLEIIKAYTDHFDQQLNDLIARLEEALIQARSLNIDFHIQRLASAVLTNNSRIASWKTYIPTGIAEPTEVLISDEKGLKEKYQALILALEQKLKNPSNSIDNKVAVTLSEGISEINKQIEDYNFKVSEYNKAISTFLSSMQLEQQAQSELNILKRNKQRFEQGIIAICNELVNKKHELKTLEQEYTQLVNSQQLESENFFNEYKDRINYYLDDVFKTPYKIDDVLHVPPQGRATQSRIGYKLTFDGQDISFNNEQIHNVKDCLSEGDKSTIALAFFMSKLDIDPDKSNKVIIFDDPLSSLDKNRRYNTTQQITIMLGDVKQLVVLSHNEVFLHELTKICSPADIKTLRITENHLDKKSFIEELNLDALVEDEYFKHIKELELFLSNSDISKKHHIAGLMRNVLETYIKFKYYRKIPRNVTMFSKLIGELEKVLPDTPTEKQTIIYKLNLICSISNMPHHGIATPGRAVTGGDINIITCPELVRLVADTLDLVENKI